MDSNTTPAGNDTLAHFVADGIDLGRGASLASARRALSNTDSAVVHNPTEMIGAAIVLRMALANLVATLDADKR